MRELEEKKQLNNEGFSLIELLVAIVVLVIIMIPIMNSFTTAMRTNAKAQVTMDATAIAESIMEEFEAYSIQEMKEAYEAEGWLIEKTPETDPDGKWVFVIEDQDTTGRNYQVEITLDPTAYASVNNQTVPDIQNLIGSTSAVFSEKKDAEINAVGIFKNYGSDKEKIEKSVERHVKVTVTKNSCSLDLGGEETQEVMTYEVMAEVNYTCDTTLLESYQSGIINSENYIIFSNKEAVKEKAADIKKKKETGVALGEDDVINSQLANVVITLRPRWNGGKDIVEIYNEDNVDCNFYLVKQGTDAYNNGYTVDCVLYENCSAGWNMPGSLENTKAACQMRTNFPWDGAGYVAIGYGDTKDTSAKVYGTSAASILNITNLTPQYAYDRIYDITVRVYEDGGRATTNALVTMTGTVTN